MELYASCMAKKLTLAAAVTLTATLLLSGAGCAKDETPPVIQQAEMPEWAVEGEKIDLSARTTDDRGVKEVYVQFDSGDKIPLTKVDSQKNSEEVANWKASFKLSPEDYTYSIVAVDRANETKKEGKITIHPIDADGDRISYRDDPEPNKKNPVSKYLLDNNLGAYVPVFAYLENDEVMHANEKASIDLAIAYYPDISQTLPGFYNEIAKLPDFSTIEEKDVEAFEDMLMLASNPKYKDAFESVLNVGIPGKRKYCSPLEALLWIAYDREFDNPANNPLERYSLEKLIREAWRDSSNDYGSNRWQSFDEVIDRLNAPELVTTYLLDNISYDCTEWKKYLETEWKKYLETGKFPKVKTPQQIFTDKGGCCVHHAMFAFYCLSQNGYMYDNFDVYKNNAASILTARPMFNIVGHVTCLYVQDGEFYIIDTGRESGRGIKGPFKTIEEAADATLPYWGVYILFDGNFIMTKVVERK